MKSVLKSAVVLLMKNGVIRHRLRQLLLINMFALFALSFCALAKEPNLSQMKKAIATADVPHLKLVEQWEIDNEESLQQKLNDITADGGEGLMLRRKASLYRGGRSNDLLKLKAFTDAEARVISHYKGKGKYTEVLGGMVVENFDGNRFKIGSGFTGEERRNPPPPGTIITYKYNGFTNSGKPRFAVFLCIRAEEPPNQ